MEIKKVTSTVHTTWAPLRKIQYIVIHYTAGASSRPGAAEATARYFAATSVQASADYIVDDGGAVQYNPSPKSRYTWAVGGSKLATQGGKLYKKCTNSNSISIEMCSTSLDTKASPNAPAWQLTKATVDNTVALVRQLMDEYNVPAERVIRHYDVTGKLCPGVIGWNIDSGTNAEWVVFQKRIGGESAGEEVETTSTPYLVRVTVNGLNIRSGPGTGYSVVGTCLPGTYTIIESKGNWGKLKSGKGWICLAYASRIN